MDFIRKHGMLALALMTVISTIFVGEYVEQWWKSHASLLAGAIGINLVAVSVVCRRTITKKTRLYVVLMLIIGIFLAIVTAMHAGDVSFAFVVLGTISWTTIMLASWNLVRFTMPQQQSHPTPQA